MATQSGQVQSRDMAVPDVELGTVEAVGKAQHVVK